jgi:hypothetical protein
LRPIFFLAIGDAEVQQSDGMLRIDCERAQEILDGEIRLARAS